MMENFAVILERYLSDKRHSGCNPEELVLMQRRYEGQLPDDYILFLKFMGKGADGFCRGSDYEYDKLEQVQGWAADLLRENGQPLLGRNGLVFFMHQGYQFYAICDGRIWFYLEGDGALRFQFDSFAQWFEFMLGA